MTDYQYFTCDISGGVATVTMNLPPLNVMDNPMMSEFNTLLDTLVVDDTLSAIVIAAEGKAFSAGVDVADHTAEKVRDMIEQFHGIFRRLASTDALTIAAVQGAALGGGCELACFCDIVLASERAKFGQPEVHVGVFPPVAAVVLPSRIGLGKAIELVSLGGTISATEAHRIGLVSQLYVADEFDDQVAAYVEDIRGLSRPVVRMAKRVTMAGQRADMLNRLDEAEKIYLDELMQLHDAHEGIAAFMEKRTPEWSHA
ncbi:MAG: enoyl-CoA hydratase/isomerase family protein [Phycisphaerales bacterium]|jgi:cyclohexa-1,5-dienecarbonyl-CoA hydratase|nr:enoyl-CoA hydratase/isomerase family protein [Phycisphaerales bacterium]MDP6889817.1 enoyl-CoA hydratase/isomerase family protein [Phycisphaerales bacterium]MDP6889860.1 enoyl-CoA hydratase/isomerase family protein [Phycisphaerales bacterium]